MLKRFIELDDGLDFTIKDNESDKLFYDCESVVKLLNELAEEREIALDGIKIADELIRKYGSDELKLTWKKEVTVKYR